MNRVLGLILFVAVGIVTGCHVPPETRSVFLSKFSVAEIIKKTGAQMTSIESGGVSSGETSSVWNDRRIYHRHESADLQVRPVEADEAAFLEKLKAEIEQRLGDNNAKVLGGGTSSGGSSGGRGFSIAYTDGKNHGWIDVFGLRGAGNNYKLIIIVNES